MVDDNTAAALFQLLRPARVKQREREHREHARRILSQRRISNTASRHRAGPFPDIHPLTTRSVRSPAKGAGAQELLVQLTLRIAGLRQLVGVLLGGKVAPGHALSA
jgi:hypothetical protein